MSEFKRLVVIPSDPLDAYVKKGTESWMDWYYNPGKLFDEVIVVSPLEPHDREFHGMQIRSIKRSELRKTLKEIKPDAVRAYGGQWAASWSCQHRIARTPLMVSVHDTNPQRIRWHLKYADLVACVSSAVQQSVENVGVSPERIRLLPNRVDIDRFKPVTDPGKLLNVSKRFPKGHSILHVGRKTKQKNISTLIYALTFLPSEYYAVFVGRGDVDSYQKEALNANVQDRCFWVDCVQNSDLPTWYSWCDCMCTPSLWEGFGIVFIEAAACGAPVITSNIAPMNEFLRNGESAHLVDQNKSPKELASAIQGVCEDEAYRNHLSAGGQLAAKEFSKDKIDTIEQGLYRELIGGLSSPNRLERSLWSAYRNSHDFISNIANR